MKPFSKFGSCWSGAAVANPEAEAPHQTAQMVDLSGGGMSRRLTRSRSAAGVVTPWKPKLTAISEDSPMTEVDRAADRLQRNRSVKVISKPPAVIAPMLGNREDYWKSTHSSALPAFSPMWFAF